MHRTNHDIRALWFDPQYRAKDEELKKAVKALTLLLEREEMNQGIRQRKRNEASQRSFRQAVEAMVCNLVLLDKVAGEAALSIPKASSSMWGQGRYANPIYGQHFLDIIGMMARLRLIEQRRGFRISARFKAPTLIRSTAVLRDKLPLKEFTWQSILRINDPEVIVLKSGKDEDNKSVPISYRDIGKVKQWRRQVQRLNAHLAKAEIEVNDKSNQLQIGDNGGLIVPLRRSLYRGFNNGRWDHGGRLWGGFWMSMKREDRFRLIRVDGEPIADVDYRQLFINLAYVIAQQEPPPGDLYDISGDGSRRDSWKILINALLFSNRALGQFPDDTRGNFPKGTKLKDLIDQIKIAHAPIAHLFGASLGYRLLNIESEMLVAVISHLNSQSITALPLHDAVLIPWTKAETAKAAMEYEFEARAGVHRAIVKIDFGPYL